MAATFTPDYEVTEIEVSPADGGRRRKITKFALAGVAVLGVGAALTSAAWSYDVWFRGDTQAGNVQLAGSVNAAGPWNDLSTDQDPIIVSDFVDIGPGVAANQVVYVRNQGQNDVTLTLDAEGHGDMFAPIEVGGV